MHISIYECRYLHIWKYAGCMAWLLWASMYVCMYVSIHICMYVCKHPCMYVCMYVSIHVCIFVSIHTYMHTYIQALQRVNSSPSVSSLCLARQGLSKPAVKALLEAVCIVCARHLYGHVPVFVCLYVYICIDVRSETCIQTHMNMHAYICFY